MLSSPPVVLEPFASLRNLLQLGIRYATYGLTFPILLAGARGTGKTVFARYLHQRSGGRGDFVDINAAAIPHELELAHLFGHSRGAYTGAHTAEPGALEMAHNGTLFIDEMAHLSMRAQELLLTSLPTGRFRRMGDQRELQVHFRLICATNEDLDELVAGDRLRADLRDRLGPFVLRLPSLSERREDILPLVEHYLAFLSARDGRNLQYHVTRDVAAILMQAPWPGNLRELWHACVHAAVRTDTGLIAPDDLPDGLIDGLPPKERSAARASTKAMRLAEALAAAEGNKSEAARRLGWGRSTVQRISAQLNQSA